MKAWHGSIIYDLMIQARHHGPQRSTTISFPPKKEHLYQFPASYLDMFDGMVKVESRRHQITNTRTCAACVGCTLDRIREELCKNGMCSIGDCESVLSNILEKYGG